LVVHLACAFPLVWGEFKSSQKKLITKLHLLSRQTCKVQTFSIILSMSYTACLLEQHNPSKRLGSKDMGGIKQLKAHPWFQVSDMF